MGVRTLVGAGGDIAALYDSTSGWAFGPVFEGWDAESKAEAFAAWFASGDALVAAGKLRMKMPAIDGRDPRMYDEVALEKLYGFWRAEAIDEEGDLIVREEEK